MLSAMTRMKLLIAVSGVVAAVASTAIPAASAAGANPWKQIGTVHDNFNQPGLAVTGSGDLHVVWVRNPTNSTQDVVHTPVTLAGTIGANTAVQTGWASIWPVPDLVATAGGLRAFWDGTSPDTKQGMFTATAPSSGGSWTLQPGLAAQSSIAADVGAALGAGGTPLFSWDSTAGVFVHAGTDPSTTDYNLQTQLGGCCGYTPDIGYDASTGDAWVAWASNATDHVGLYAQKVDATSGAPIGSASRLPQSATMFNGELNFNQQIARTPVVTGRHAAYVAYTGGYPSANRILLWKLSSAGVTTPLVVATGSNMRTPGVAADSAGHIWVIWSADGVVHARRSNAAVTRFGATVSVSKPPAGGCDTIYELTTAAATSRLHIVATDSCTSGLGLYYTQVFPGLSVSASPSSFRGKSTVTFTVTDAGSAVKGATVHVGGKTDSTDSKGHATVVLGPVKKKTKFVATATDHFYVQGRTTIVAKPK